MRILHTADWHLGKKLDQYSRIPEQVEVMNEICRIADQEKVDVVLVAGDLFDTFNPSAEAQELLYKTLHQLSQGGSRPVIAIAGNHDMPERIEAPHPLAAMNGIIMPGFPATVVSPFMTEAGIEVRQSAPGFIELFIKQLNYPLRLLFTPYANELRLRTYLNEHTGGLGEVLGRHWKSLADQYCDDKGINMLLAHLYVMKEGGTSDPEDEGERSILHVGGAEPIYTRFIPEQIQYTALGHLHRFQQIDASPGPVIYSSSPLCYSFAEAGQTKKVVIIDAEPGKQVAYKSIDLNAGKQLLRNRFTSVDDAVAWLSAHTNAYVELTMVTETFFDGSMRKQLTEAHDYIVDIIPEIISTDEHANGADSAELDDSRDMQSLFSEYFQSKFGQLPSEDIMALFREINSQNEEE